MKNFIKVMDGRKYISVDTIASIVFQGIDSIDHQLYTIEITHKDIKHKYVYGYNKQDYDKIKSMFEKD